MSIKAPNILLVEDHQDLRLELLDYLEQMGFAVESAVSLMQMHQRLASQAFTILLLDLSLPDGDGLTQIAALRAQHRLQLGIIILSARNHFDERTQALELGADFYLTKPVHLPELTALIKQLQLRLQPNTANHWQLELPHKQLTAPNGLSCKLTATELRLLTHLCQQSETTGREQLCQLLQHNLEVVSTRKLDTLISRLRTKVKLHCQQELPLITYRNLGYALSDSITMEPATTNQLQPNNAQAR